MAELADLVRMMNSYYSNLIEGHNTRPLDIERALTGAPVELEKRPLALEAKAHVEVQGGIDVAYASGKLPVPVSAKFISLIHKSFYDDMPPEFRVVRRKDGTEIPIVRAPHMELVCAVVQLRRSDRGLPSPRKQSVLPR